MLTRMLTYVSRLSLAATLVILAMLLPLGSAQAVTHTQASTTRNGPDVSTEAAAQEFTRQNADQLASFQQDIRAARPFVTVDKDGYFHVSSGYHPRQGGLNVGARLTLLNSSLREFSNQQQRAELMRAMGAPISADAYWCAYLPNWALDAYAWYVIIVGGAEMTISLFLDVTVVGIPLGVVVGVLGIWTGLYGGGLLWFFDKYYPNGVWICS